MNKINEDTKMVLWFIAGLMLFAVIAIFGLDNTDVMEHCKAQQKMNYNQCMVEMTK